MILHGTTPVSVDLFASKKRTLRKLYLALALISAASIQTACSATISGSESISASTPDAANDAAPVDATTDASSVATTAPTDHATDGTTDDFGSVIPPLGAFDRRDPDFIQYKPCLEMPDDFLAEAGLHGKEMMEGIGIKGGICTFPASNNSSYSVFKLQGSHHSFRDYEAISGEIRWGTTIFGVPVLLHRSEFLSESECQASVETHQGTLSIAFQSFTSETHTHDPCEVAQNKLMTILELDGKYES